MISLARIDGAVDDGSTVLVRWGGFSSEERCLIRAEVSPLPFIPRERRRDLGTG